MRHSLKKSTGLSFLLFLGLGVMAAHAGDTPTQKRAPAAAAATTTTEDNRKKSIDFSDELVEGMNKNPLDSLESLKDRDPKSGGHLYHKREHFKQEMRDNVKELGHTP